MSGTSIMQYDTQDTTSGLKDGHLMVFLRNPPFLCPPN